MQEICDCGKPAMHTVSYRDKTSHLCCECNVRGGGAPADWHRGCMEAFREIEQEKAAKKLRAS